MNRTSTNTRVDAIMLDATILTSLIHPAVAAIDQARAGFPSSTPGASPLPGSVRTLAYDADGEPINDTYTVTERAALNRDPAELDLKALNNAIRIASTQLRLAAILARKWATPTLGTAAVAERITAADDGIWCDNCAEHGHKNVRRPGGGRMCEFCAKFQSKWKQPAPKEVLDLKLLKGRVYDADSRRILARLRDQRKEMAS